MSARGDALMLRQAQHEGLDTNLTLSLSKGERRESMQGSIEPTQQSAAFGVARSFTGRRWRLSDTDEDAALKLARDANISAVLARLLLARGVAAGDVADYLNPTLKRFLPEPLTLKDMDKAIARVAA